MAGFFVLAAVFIRVELRTESPMIQLRLFQDPLLSVSVVSGFLVFAGLSATFFLLPFYLEGVLGFEIGRVGLLLAAGPLVLGVVAPISGTLSDRWGIRSLTLSGLFILTAVFLGFQFLSTETTWWQYVLIAVPLGAGVGIFQSPNNSAIMGSIPREYSGVGGGLLNLTRLLGQITGIAVLGSVWASRVLASSSDPVPGNNASAASATAQVEALHFTFAIAGALIGTAAVIGLWALRKERMAIAEPVPAI
jgi:MFS family permease